MWFGCCFCFFNDYHSPSFLFLDVDPSKAMKLEERVKQQKLTVAERLFASGASVDQTTNNVLSLLVGASVELSQCQYAVLSRRRRLNFFLFKLSSTLSIITWTC